MKVTLIHPTWYNLPGLLDTIAEIVFREGGDGWCWIKCANPEEVCKQFVEHLNNKNEQKFIYDKSDNGYVVTSPYSREEHWLFTTKVCDSSFYDSIVEIE